MSEHEFWLIVVSAPILWILNKLFDWILDVWRLRSEPMTMAQVRRHHRWRFAMAVASFVWLAVGTLICLWGMLHAAAPIAIDYAITIAVAAASVYLWRVVRRRWRRLHE